MKTEDWLRFERERREVLTALRAERWVLEIPCSHSSLQGEAHRGILEPRGLGVHRARSVELRYTS